MTRAAGPAERDAAEARGPGAGSAGTGRGRAAPGAAGVWARTATARRRFHLGGTVLAAVLSLSCARAPRAADAPPNGAAAEVAWLDTGLGRLKATAYRSARLDGRPALAGVLHGDLLRSPPPAYHARFARRAAARADNAVVAALLRPGYSDGEGASDGPRGQATGDSYTPEVVDAVAQAVAALKARHGAGRVVLVGHSGGAAIAADLLGRHPETADAALLVSCSCDLPAWRRHMKAAQGGRVWDEPVSSISPVDVASTVPKSAQVRMLAGARDGVVPPGLTLAYAAALRANGVPANAAVLPDLPHNILLEPAVLEALRPLLVRRDDR